MAIKITKKKCSSAIIPAAPSHSDRYRYDELRGPQAKQNALETARLLLLHDLRITDDIQTHYLTNYALHLPRVLDFDYSTKKPKKTSEKDELVIISDVIGQIGKLASDEDGKCFFTFGLTEQYSRMFVYNFWNMLEEYEKKLSCKFSRRVISRFKTHRIYFCANGENDSGKYPLQLCIDRSKLGFALSVADQTVVEGFAQLLNSEILATGYEAYKNFIDFIDSQIDSQDWTEQVFRYPLMEFSKDGYLYYSSDGGKVFFNDEFVTPQMLQDTEKYPEPLLKFSITVE